MPAVLEVLVVSAVLVAAASGLQTTTEFCVTPMEEPSCNCSIVTAACLTLDEYLFAPGEYFKSNVTFRFLPGEHHVHEAFNGSDIAGLKFIQDKNTSVVTLFIASSNTSAWFMLNNSQSVSFSGIHFQMNGSSPSSSSNCYTYILELWNVSSLVFSDIDFNSSVCGGCLSVNYGNHLSISNVGFSYTNHSGLNINNIIGSITVEQSNFTGSSAASILMSSSNYHFASSNCSKFVIESSDFRHIYGGLHLFFSNVTGCFNVSVRHSRFSVLEAYGIQLQSFDNSSDFQLGVELDSNKLENSSKVGIVMSLHNVDRVYINNCSFKHNRNNALEMYLGKNLDATVEIQNSQFTDNWVSSGILNVPATALLIENYAGCREPSVRSLILRNVSFHRNGGVGDVTTPVVLLCINLLKLIDCSFVNNSGTAIHAVSSTLAVEGTLNFTNNTASEGAAIYFDGQSKLDLNTSGTTIYFTDNHALLGGGAITVSNNDLYPRFSNPLCFLSIDDNVNVSLLFFNNTSEEGGDAIYGGSLDQAISSNQKQSCIVTVNVSSHFNLPDHDQRNNLSLISSEPSRVCLCENDTPHCLKYTKNVTIFPGQTHKIHAYVVGQHFGTSKGTVYAQFLDKHTTTNLSPLQRSQKVGQYSCNELEYTVNTSQIDVLKTLILTAVDVTVSDYVDYESIQNALKTYYNSKNATVPLELLQIPVYVIIKFKDCPIGFSFSSEGNRCTCIHQLEHLPSKYGVECDINTLQIQRRNGLWVQPSDGVLSYSEYCSPSYCNASRIKIEVENGYIDRQCKDNRTGILCGKCQNGTSLAIGSSRCLPHCPNNHLFFLLVFGAAGVLLVLLIKYLNLTVTQGALNGLTFYANIVQTSNSVFLASDQTGVRVFAVFIAWLNLDFGIETCFSRGLDMYTKTWLQFVFPLYIWTLVGGIILVCRFSVRATRFFGNNTVQVLATLFLLSYNKLLRTITVV